MRITAAMLRAADACEESVWQFEAAYGDGVELTPENWAAALATDLQWWWLAHLLPTALLTTYRAGCAPLLATYDAGCALLFATYDADRAPLLYNALVTWLSTEQVQS